MGLSTSSAESDPGAAVAEAVDRRRNFAIISHPDAGKTTLTEKLLLYGGAIQQAGAVKARGEQRKVTSDWMELEKQRGISITSTVLQFDYDTTTINLLEKKRIQRTFPMKVREMKELHIKKSLLRNGNMQLSFIQS